MKDDFGELERIAAALEAAGDVAYEWTVATGMVEWLGRPTPALGETFSAITTADALAERIFADDISRRSEALALHLSGEGVYDCEYRIRDDHDDPIWIHDRGVASLDAKGHPQRIVGVLRSIGARKAREAQLEFKASHDELTGHFNRARLKESLDHALNFASRYSVAGAYLVVGIDKLGPINDAFGH